MNTAGSARFKLRDLPGILKDTAKAWNADDPWRLSAIVAYYAVLSLPALLVVIINLVGSLWGKEIVEGRLTDEISNVLGKNVADAVRVMIANSQSDKRNLISSVIGIGLLIFGSTGVFYQLQISLNKVWQVKPDPKIAIVKILADRAKSFGFILVIGFLLLISFIITAGITVLSDFITSIFPDFVVYIAYGVDVVLSLGIISVLFALIFKYLPDARISWNSVWPGAIITSVLFVIGKFLLGYYFGKADPGSIYGAAGSIVLILLWVSYSSLILFFGAEFSWVYANRYGLGVKPNSHSIRVKEEVVVTEEDTGRKTVKAK